MKFVLLICLVLLSSAEISAAYKDPVEERRRNSFQKAQRYVTAHAQRNALKIKRVNKGLEINRAYAREKLRKIKPALLRQLHRDRDKERQQRDRAYAEEKALKIERAQQACADLTHLGVCIDFSSLRMLPCADASTQTEEAVFEEVKALDDMSAYERICGNSYEGCLRVMQRWGLVYRKIQQRVQHDVAVLPEYDLQKRAVLEKRAASKILKSTDRLRMQQDKLRKNIVRFDMGKNYARQGKPIQQITGGR